MTNFRLMKIGQAIALNEFRGSGILQNEQYLQVVGAENNIVVSLSLAPGYYLSNVDAMGCNSELSITPGNLRPLR